MTKHLGIFLNNTESEVNYKINIINYNNLSSNFNDIIVIDLNTQYSNLLKNDIYDVCSNDSKIIKYYLENNIKHAADDYLFIKLKTYVYKYPYFIYGYSEKTTIPTSNVRYHNFSRSQVENMYENELNTSKKNKTNEIIQDNDKLSLYSDKIKEKLANEKTNSQITENFISSKKSILSHSEYDSIDDESLPFLFNNYDIFIENILNFFLIFIFIFFIIYIIIIYENFFKKNINIMKKLLKYAPLNA